MQGDCQKLYNWSEEWLMKLNVNKCKVLTIARTKNVLVNKYGFETVSDGFLELERVNSMKDLGITVDMQLSYRDHIHDKINKAYQMTAIIYRNFKDIDINSFKIIYKSFVRSHLEYGCSVWSPYKKNLIDAIEKVQKKATRMVHGLNRMSYKERLIYLKLPTLKFRRMRGDMIEVFKILTNRYEREITPDLVKSEFVITRGNCLKLQMERSRYDLRKFSFTSRIVSIWNSLPDEIVTATSTNIFKNRLDKYWDNLDVLYDYEATL